MRELLGMIVLAASGSSMQLCQCPGLGQSNKARKKVARGWEGLCLCSMGWWSAQDVLVSSSEAVALEQGVLQTFSFRQVDCLFLLALFLSPLCSRKGEFTLCKCKAYTQFSWSSVSQPNQQELFGNDRSQLRSVLIWGELY